MKETSNYIDKLWLLSERSKIISSSVVPIRRDEPLDPGMHLDKEKFFLELGPGWGEVALELAESNPNLGFFLAEKKINRVHHILKEIEKRKIQNIKILILNFNWFFGEIFMENSFEEILMNFPDPWPKTRHKKHRSFDKKFLESLLKVLKIGGRFQFSTDHGGYARDTIRTLRSRDYKDRIDFSYSLKRDSFPTSYFESIQKRQNKRIYYLSFQKLQKL